MRCYRWLENSKGKHKEVKDNEMQTHTETLNEKKKKKSKMAQKKVNRG